MDMDFTDKKDKYNWEQMSHEEKNHALLLKQKALLDKFLKKGAISQARMTKAELDAKLQHSYEQ